MKTISLKMPEALSEKLDSTARERDESKSALLRELVQMTVVGKKNGDGSGLDLAKDLAGCVNEDKDLSFNKKRMNGYGK
jgi:metal-responsive CopG/Arc/MetJ family transcriptional regulator